MGMASPPSATGSDPRSPIAGRVFKLSERDGRKDWQLLFWRLFKLTEHYQETTLRMISSQLTWTWTLFFLFQVDTAPGTALRFLEMPSLTPETVGSMLSSVCVTDLDRLIRMGMNDGWPVQATWPRAIAVPCDWSIMDFYLEPWPQASDIVQTA
ncbi:unnamed protein product [Musa acuminata subsp. burmannicoides]